MQKISIKQISRLCKKNLLTDDAVHSLTDHRKKHEIALPQIIEALLYTTILSIKSFLKRDKSLRKQFFRRFLHSKRKMVASDSTLNRNLGNNIKTEELREISQKMITKKDRPHQVNRTLNRICAILDGTFVGGFMKEFVMIPGKTDMILDFNTIPAKGKELVSAAVILNKLKNDFGKGHFDLILGDALYYTQNIFRQCREELGSHLLVKTSEKLCVTKDADELVKNYPNDVEMKKGYDCDRQCSYQIQVISDIKGPTIDYPVQVAVIEEKDQKETRKFYVITTDLLLTPEELRYAAHLRWRIENNVFKELNQLYGTKQKYLKNEKCFENLLWIICMAYNLFQLYLFEIDLTAVSLKSKTVLSDYTDCLYESLIMTYCYDSS